MPNDYPLLHAALRWGPTVAALLPLLLLGAPFVAAQTPGCTDAHAQNFDPGATRNDGSCTYRDTVLAPLRQTPLDAKLVETSGLAFVGDALYSHNDSDDARVYRVDTLAGAALDAASLAPPPPFDWEALAIEDGLVYVGDFGNNASGNRRDLRILTLPLADLLAGRTRADTIHFAYADQADFAARPGNTTDFDCEAFFVTPDSIYLLTKEWTGLGTALYALPNRPGRHLARSRGRLAVGGLVTDCSYRPADRSLTLVGYSSSFQPFAYLLYGFSDGDFFGGSKRKVALQLPFHQVEGVATRDGRRYYVSNERFSRSIIDVPQGLSVFDLGGLMAAGPVVGTRGLAPPSAPRGPAFFPNPAGERVAFDGALLPAVVTLRDSAGRVVLARRLVPERPVLDLETLPGGAYNVFVGGAPHGTLVKVE